MTKTLKGLKTERGVSPVIATVILVAVAITVAVAVAYWMGGIAGGFTKFEQIEIQTGYSTKSASGWNITLELKNTGTAASTINRVFINEVPIPSTNYGASGFVTTATSTDILSNGTTIDSGSDSVVYIWIDDGYGSLSSGTTINIKLHSAGGMDYIKLIELI
jgi:flagellin-like protein